MATRPRLSEPLPAAQRPTEAERGSSRLQQRDTLPGSPKHRQPTTPITPRPSPGSQAANSSHSRRLLRPPRCCQRYRAHQGCSLPVTLVPTTNAIPNGKEPHRSTGWRPIDEHRLLRSFRFAWDLRAALCRISVPLSRTCLSCWGGLVCSHRRFQPIRARWSHHQPPIWIWTDPT